MPRALRSASRQTQFSSESAGAAYLDVNTDDVRFQLGTRVVPRPCGHRMPAMTTTNYCCPVEVDPEGRLISRRRAADTGALQ